MMDSQVHEEMMKRGHMIVYIPGSGPKKRLDFCRKNDIGSLFSPYWSNYPSPEDKKYIVDNGAYRAYLKGEILDINKFYNFLGKIDKCCYPPDFVCIPDIVADGKKSFEFSFSHIGKIPEKFKKFWVVQDGQYPAMIEETVIHLIDGLFIGGSTIWKWRTAHLWIELAHDYGLRCHIGRVGTWKNFLRAYNLGADSVDGSTPMRHNQLHKIVEWNKNINKITKLCPIYHKQEVTHE